MANSLGLGITITVNGNYQGKLAAAEKGMKGVTDAQKKLNRQQQKNSSILLKQAAAFGLLGTALRRVGDRFSSVGRSGIGIFKNMIKAGGEFQEAMLGLKVFFGDDSERMAAAVLNVANQSDVALNDVTNIARRIGGVGLPANEAARAVNILTQAMSTLSGQARTRAIQGVANILEQPAAAARLLDTGFSEAEKKQILLAKGSARTAKILDALEQRFGSVNKIMSKGFFFGLRQIVQLLEVFQARITLPILQELNEPLSKIVQSMNRLVEEGNGANTTIGKLQSIFRSLMSPLTNFVKLVADMDLVPRFLNFLAENPTLVKSFAFIGTIGASILGAALSLAGTIGIFIGSFKLLAASGIGSALAGIGSAIGGVFGAFASLGAPGFIALAGVIVLIKESLGPLARLLMSAGSALLLLGRGVFQAISTGRIASDVFDQLRARGLEPLFKIMVFVGSRTLAFFKGFFAATSAIVKPLIQVFINDFVRGFKNFMFAIQSILQSLGFLQDGSTKTFFGIGAAVGGVIGLLVDGVLLIGQVIALPIRLFFMLFKIVVGVFNVITGIVKMISGLGGTVLGKLVGGGTGDAIQRQSVENLTGASKDFSNAIGNFTLFGDSQQNARDTRGLLDRGVTAVNNTTKVDLSIDGRKVGQAVQQDQLLLEQSFNEG